MQRRTHNLLLFQKLLNLRDGASPFTLLLDTIDQSAKPVVKEFMTRAKVGFFILSPRLKLMSTTLTPVITIETCREFTFSFSP